MTTKKSSYKSPLLVGALLLLNTLLSANKNANEKQIHLSQKEFFYHEFPNPIKKLLLKQQKNNKIAALLAFPFPFGCVGLHRVYLKTSPYVPIVYAATAGGIFGIIPLIDCLVLLSKKDIQNYENNSNVIMWINHPSKNSNSPKD